MTWGLDTSLQYDCRANGELLSNDESSAIMDREPLSSLSNKYRPGIQVNWLRHCTKDRYGTSTIEIERQGWCMDENW